MSKKLSVLLGLRDKIEKTQANMLADMTSKFKGKQTLFQGHRDTYDAIAEYADDPTKRGFKAVESTVGDQLAWYKKYSKDYMNTVFSIEKTNSIGVKAHLIVEGNDWGEFSTLELLRLKSILDGKTREMIKELPIRSETSIWTKTTAPEFEGREGIWETPIDSGHATTTLKRMEVVADPYVKEAPGRAPVVQQVDSKVNVGKYTKQRFSGEITNLQRATMEVKINTLYQAVIEALETANNIDSEESTLGDKVLDFLF